jgi:hypothetical protein
LPCQDSGRAKTGLPDVSCGLRVRCRSSEERRGAPTLWLADGELGRRARSVVVVAERGAALERASPRPDHRLTTTGARRASSMVLRTVARAEDVSRPSATGLCSRSSAIVLQPPGLRRCIVGAKLFGLEALDHAGLTRAGRAELARLDSAWSLFGGSADRGRRGGTTWRLPNRSRS